MKVSQSRARLTCRRPDRLCSALPDHQRVRHLAVDETGILLTLSLSTTIETPAKWRGGCSRMTVSPPGWRHPTARRLLESEDDPPARVLTTRLLRATKCV